MKRVRALLCGSFSVAVGCGFRGRPAGCGGGGYAGVEGGDFRGGAAH